MEAKPTNVNEMDVRQRVDSWAFTLWDQVDVVKFSSPEFKLSDKQTKHIKYLIFQKEKGTTVTGNKSDGIHIQGYVEFYEHKALIATRNTLDISKKNNLSHRWSTPEKAANYCAKFTSHIEGPWEYLGKDEISRVTINREKIISLNGRCNPDYVDDDIETKSDISVNSSVSNKGSASSANSDNGDSESSRRSFVSKLTSMGPKEVQVEVEKPKINMLDIFDLIDRGYDLLSIARIYPNMFSKNISAIKEYMRATDEKNHMSDRSRNVYVEVRYGTEDCGKTFDIMTKGEHLPYKLRPPGGGGTIWWNGYQDQKVILLDDFYGWIKYNELLDILDKYPLMMEKKFGHCYAKWEKVYITSNVAPEQWYSNSYGMTAALARRINVVKKFTKHKLLNEVYKSRLSKSMLYPGCLILRVPPITDDIINISTCVNPNGEAKIIFNTPSGIENDLWVEHNIDNRLVDIIIANRRPIMEDVLDSDKGKHSKDTAKDCFYETGKVEKQRKGASPPYSDIEGVPPSISSSEASPPIRNSAGPARPPSANLRFYHRIMINTWSSKIYDYSLGYEVENKCIVSVTRMKMVVNNPDNIPNLFKKKTTYPEYKY